MHSFIDSVYYHTIFRYAYIWFIRMPSVIVIGLLVGCLVWIEQWIDQFVG